MPTSPLEVDLPYGAIRRAFAQYVDLRPIRFVEGVQSPLRTTGPVGLVVVRENAEGECSAVGGRVGQGTPAEFALQESVLTRAGVSRIADHAVELAASRRGPLTSATRSNGIVHTMPFWDEVVAERAARRRGVQLTSEHIDALAATFVLQPERFDVVVASHLFGDVL